jgi:inorganic pyrophosphatase
LTQQEKVFEVVIENPVGSSVRSKYDKERGWVESGPRFAMPLPFEYGFVPATLNPADGEALDVLVVGYGPTFPGCRYGVRAIGLLLRADGDHKVVAVPHTSDFLSPVEDVAELDPAVRRGIEAWFERCFVLEGWRDARGAQEWIVACRAARSEWQMEEG